MVGCNVETLAGKYRLEYTKPRLSGDRLLFENKSEVVTADDITHALIRAGAFVTGFNIRTEEHLALVPERLVQLHPYQVIREQPQKDGEPRFDLLEFFCPNVDSLLQCRWAMCDENNYSEEAAKHPPTIELPDIEEKRRDIRKIFEELRQQLPKAREIGIDTTPPFESWVQTAPP